MRKQWTKNEILILERGYGRYPVVELEKRINRSERAIRCKIRRLKLTRVDDLSANAVAQCFHISPTTVTKWIYELDLPAKKIKSNGRVVRHLIDPEEFWKWAEQHKDIIDWSNYEKKTLLPEPKWIKELPLVHRRKPKRYTDMEISRVKMLMRKGLTYQEIADSTGRSLSAISSLCLKLRKEVQ